ncbi:pentapeptide repeat-containing protein [Fructobacillus sp. EFB-N1]|uniref:pentapeptide repeat-containing protein n=1 Tax=Fructobacillus sp. EFB-N1 TaxID=1658766 RepID=UPI003510391B
MAGCCFSRARFTSSGIPSTCLTGCRFRGTGFSRSNVTGPSFNKCSSAADCYYE